MSQKTAEEILEVKHSSNRAQLKITSRNVKRSLITLFAGGILITLASYAAFAMFKDDPWVPLLIISLSIICFIGIWLIGFTMLIIGIFKGEDIRWLIPTATLYLVPVIIILGYRLE